ncbi:MAG: clan AA aspartic protease [Cyclobacteriaceae bacterium]
MGLTYADIELVNADDLALNARGYLTEDKVKKITVTMLVDSGAYSLAINENIKTQLDLRFIEEQVVEMADGSKKRLQVVGPVDVKFQNRSTTVRAIVLPGDVEPLLGAIPMEDMDLWIDPRNQELKVNPDSPLIAKKPLK